jgi:hypothetical protein
MTTLYSNVPLTLLGPNDTSEQLVEPQTPSPKRSKSLQPTELGPYHQSSVEVAVIPQAGQSTSNLPVDTLITSAGEQARTFISNAALPLASSGFPPAMMVHPSLPPNTTIGRDERFGYSQVGGGYPSHAPQAPFFPLHGNEGGMFPLQQGMMNMRRAMHFNISAGHPDDTYLGAYGSFYPHAEGSRMYPDANMPPFVGPSDEWHHQALFGGSIRPCPHPHPVSRQSSIAVSDTQQLHSRQASVVLPASVN